MGNLLQLQRGAGVLIPVFSLRSLHSLGIGEFYDLKLLVDWVAECKLKLIQILPVLDTTATKSWRDSYPYSPISSVALHPLYLHLPAIGNLSENLLEEINSAKQELLHESVDFDRVYELKWKFLRRIFEEVGVDAGFEAFCLENGEWLKPYACFCALRDRYQTAIFDSWGDDSDPTDEQIAKIYKERDAQFYCFLQYHLDKQLREVSQYALGKEVLLKGDFPVGVHRYSSDVWAWRKRFDLTQSIGAPPDQFSSRGQNWGFPSYNWEVMEAEDFAWFKLRLKRMEPYFPIIRIDHILGFFRLWEIPIESINGLLGHFLPAHPLTNEELKRIGIDDPDKLTMPLFNFRAISALCKEDATLILNKYLDKYDDDLFCLKTQYDTQQKILTEFCPLDELNDEQNALRTRIKNHLFNLTENVVLISDREKRGYHPRFNCALTPAFQQLSEKSQMGLKRLHDDYFYHRQDTLWKEIGLKMLNMIRKATKMIICAEDLGFVSPCVQEVLDEVSFLSLFIQRWSKEPSKDFSDPKFYPDRSVCSPANHDTSTLRQWWKEGRVITQQFYNQMLGGEDRAPEECEPEIVKQIFEQHLISPARWSIFLLQDILALNAQLRHPNPNQERINNPEDPNHYWNYRMHITLEELCEQCELNDLFKAMIVNGNR